MRRWKGLTPSIGAVIVLWLLAASPAWGMAIGYAFDFSTCSFSYTVGSGPGGKVGTITISDNELYGSLMSMSKLDLGADGEVGGGGANADTDLDYAANIDGSTFDVRIVADVIKMGANDYRLDGTLKITDTGSSLSAPKVFADFASNTVALSSGFFYYDGDLSISGPNDAVLLPDSSSSWTYDGVGADTPVSPNEDGVVGRVTQSVDRDGFDRGALNGGYYAGSGSLDAFFSTNRASTSISAQAYVVPEPVTLALALAGLGWMVRGRR